MNADEAVKACGSNAQGLSLEEAQARHALGANELKQKKGKTTLELFVDQLKDFMIVVLIIAAVISGIMGETVDAIVILAIVILNAVIGVVQQKKAEGSLAALKKMSAPSAKVIRSGKEHTIPASQVVVGDVVLLEAGDRVPADMRLLQSVNLKVQESALTGESLPVEKDASAGLPEDAQIGDRINMAFSGTVVTYGRGRGLITAIGMQTEVGRIADILMQEDERDTPLQQKLEALGKVLAVGALVVCVLIFTMGIIYGKPFLEMFLTAVSLAVAAIPEGLPAIATIVLALSVQRMVKRNAIVRTLPAVETLGSASVICSDKTGTLTQNRMEVKMIYADGAQIEPAAVGETRSDAMWRLLEICALCNDARYNAQGGGVTAVGDPTEIALVDLCAKLGMDKAKTEERLPRVAEIPFDSERKLMTTVHVQDNAMFSFTKGGVDIILDRCTHILENDAVRPMTEQDKERIRGANKEMADQALRVLGMAYKDIPELPRSRDMDSLERELVYVGMAGMMDPPREEAKAAVATCREAGIRVVMITGDHLATAVAVAKTLEILREGDLTITGAELAQMSDEELDLKVENISVYARISPEHKVRIVKAWQGHGHVVAMTGDGVNDAPALKKADIGCAMGIVGTEVAKEAADLILTDDNFATVVSAVEEGRRIYDNIMKAIQYLLACNIGEIITLFVATMLNWSVPLLPVHILWVNLVTDSLPALGLGIDPAERDIMRRKANRAKSLFTPGMVWRMAYRGVLVGAVTLAAFVVGLGQYGVQVGRTMAFCVLAFSQLFSAYGIRSARHSAFSRAVGKNPYLLGGTLLSALAMFAVLLITPLQGVFETVSLSFSQWGYVAMLSIAPLLVVEVMKLLRLNGTRRDER
jgi:Ca2+-transporting ATPase